VKRLITLLMLIGLSLTAACRLPRSRSALLFTRPSARNSIPPAARKAASRWPAEKEQDAAAPVAEILTLGGSVRRSDGKSTYGINNARRQRPETLAASS